MTPQTPSRLAWWLVGALVACSDAPPAGFFADAPVQRSAAPTGFVSREKMPAVTPLPPALFSARRLSVPPPPGPALSDEVLEGLGAPIGDATFDMDVGAAMVDALEDEPAEDVAIWGASSLTLGELFGTAADPYSAVCEQPHALFSFDDGGPWEASVWFATWYHLASPVQTLFMTPSAGCVAALDTVSVADAVDTSECSEEEEHGFFANGTACRACLDGTDPFAACVDAGECDDVVPLVMKHGGEFYEWASVEVLACAPDVRGTTLLGAVDLPDDGTVPAPWDHAVWAVTCLAVRESANGNIGMACLAEDEPSDLFYTTAVAQGVFSSTDWLKEAGSDDLRHVGRQFFTPRIDFVDGTRLDATFLKFWDLGEISTPFVAGDGNGDGVVNDGDWGRSGGQGGYGFTPNRLRPGGTDVNDLDDLFARDWLGVMVVKTATTREGVPINVINHSRCEGWAGPDASGAWTCVQRGAGAFPWFEDIHVWAGSETQVIAETMMTLGSTGLPDPLVPGGFVTHLAGTASLANPDWDACEWPNQFVPDHIQAEDTYLDWGGQASIDAHTYKFGKDPEQDLRVVLATPQERGYCSD
jgi:hypothetical protein